MSWDLVDPMHPTHILHIQQAMAEAEYAARAGDVPVGAVIVSWDRGEVIASAHNQREVLRDPTAHAEIIAITQAAAALDSWRLERCAIYVTLEPCPMCAGAIVQARIPLVVFGCRDPKAGACESLFTITHDPRLNHRCQVVGGVLEEECSRQLREFFRDIRIPGNAAGRIIGTSAPHDI